MGCGSSTTSNETASVESPTRQGASTTVLSSTVSPVKSEVSKKPKDDSSDLILEDLCGPSQGKSSVVPSNNDPTSPPSLISGSQQGLGSFVPPKPLERFVFVAQRKVIPATRAIAKMSTTPARQQSFRAPVVATPLPPATPATGASRRSVTATPDEYNVKTL